MKEEKVTKKSFIKMIQEFINKNFGLKNPYQLLNSEENISWEIYNKYCPTRIYQCSSCGKKQEENIFTCYHRYYDKDYERYYTRDYVVKIGGDEYLNHIFWQYILNTFEIKVRFDEEIFSIFEAAYVPNMAIWNYLRDIYNPLEANKSMQIISVSISTTKNHHGSKNPYQKYQSDNDLPAIQKMGLEFNTPEIIELRKKSKDILRTISKLEQEHVCIVENINRKPLEYLLSGRDNM
jgi:hypothetical protein